MAEPMDLLFSTPKMSTAFSLEAHVQGMLAFEAALARKLAPGSSRRRPQTPSRPSAEWSCSMSRLCTVRLPWSWCLHCLQVEGSYHERYP